MMTMSHEGARPMSVSPSRNTTRRGTPTTSVKLTANSSVPLADPSDFHPRPRFERRHDLAERRRVWLQHDELALGAHREPVPVGLEQPELADVDLDDRHRLAGGGPPTSSARARGRE